MAEIFGTIAAAVALGPIVLQLSRSLRDGARSIKFARRELEELTNEMQGFTALYCDFHNACSTRKRQTGLVLSAQKRLADWTKKAIEDFKELSYTVDALSTEPIYQHTTFQVAVAHYDWYRSKSYLEYLRASLSVARQSMNGFTNICNMELLDEQIMYLKSLLTVKQKREIEKEFGMPLGKRIEVLQSIRGGRELQQVELLDSSREASNKVSAYEKQSQGANLAEQTTQLLAFSDSVNRYVDRILPPDNAGNRPPRSPRRPRKGSRSHRHDSSLTSQSIATTPTHSTQSSIHQTQVQDSPPTSPEPTHGEPPSEPQVDEEAPISILNYCERCLGTCVDTAAHDTSVQYVPSEATSHTSVVVPPVASVAPLKLASNKRRACSCPQSRRNRVSSQSPVPPTPPSNPCRDNIQYRTEPSIHPVINEEDEQDISDRTSEEEYPRHEQAREAGPSIWQATGAFGEREPKGLRERRRQRSGSPQDFW